MTEQEMDKLLTECHVWGSYEGEPAFIYNALRKVIQIERESFKLRAWTTEMNDAWNRAIPDLSLAFDDLIKTKSNDDS